jgi:2-keto-3-deoxy-L-rhamnonate aldolase RhmA
MTVRNPARERLQKDELCLGIGLRQARTVDIAAAMASCGYDWLFIDLEHGSMPLDVAVQISVAALTAGISPVVRVPSRQYSLATRVLDGGALGIVMPHVDTAEEASAIVDHLKYPPLGHRSMGGGLPYFGFRAVPTGDAAATMNAETLLVVMHETPQAIASAEAIAAVEGVDVLHVGCNDLLTAMGKPGAFGCPEVVVAIERVIAAAGAHGKYAGLGGERDLERQQAFIRKGVRFVTTQTDIGFLLVAAGERTAQIRRGMKS